MSYDLVLRRQLARDISRGDEPRPPGPRAEGLRAVVAGLVLLLPDVVRAQQNRRHRRPYERDELGFDLDKTVEVPAITDRDLVYGRRESA